MNSTHFCSNGLNWIAALSRRTLFSLAASLFVCLASAAALPPATLSGPQGELAVSERGIGFTPRGVPCPAIRATGTPLWTMLLQDGVGANARKITITSNAQKPRLETTAAAVQLVYDNITNATNTWNVALTLNFARKENAFEITAELHNQHEGTLVRELKLAPVAGLDATPATHPFIMPKGLGQKFSDDAKSFSASFSYPSAGGTMQWCSFAGKDGGLYVGAHDAARGPKAFTANYDAKSRHYTLTVRHYFFCANKGRWSMPPMVLLPYKGTWHVAAKHYRAWFDSARLSRPAADWVKDSTGWLLCILKQQNGSVMWDYPSLVQLADLADQRGLNMIGLFGWTVGGHDHLYPDYVPDDKMGGASALRKSLAEIRRRGKKAILYANGQIMDTSTEYFRTEGKLAAVINEEGNLVHENWQKFKSYPEVKCVLACQSSLSWQERMRALALQAHVLGADGIIFDELGGRGPLVCCATNHGHPVPAMVNALERSQWLKRVADDMRRIAPHFIVMTEGLHDSILESISLFHGYAMGEFTPTPKEMLERLDNTNKTAPFPEMFRFTFPEVLTTQRHPVPMLNRIGANYAFTYGMRFEIESRYAPDVKYLKTGAIPTAEDYGDVLSPPNVTMMSETPPAEATRYLRQMIELQRRHASLLWGGRFVDDEGFDFKAKRLLAKGFASGRELGVVLWNPTDEPQSFALNMPDAALVAAEEPEREKAEALAPLAAQSVRLLIYRKK